MNTALQWLLYSGFPTRFSPKYGQTPSSEVTSRAILLTVTAGTVFTCSAGASFRYRLPGGAWSGWVTTYTYTAGGGIYLEINGPAPDYYLSYGPDFGVSTLTMITTSGEVVVDHNFVLTTKAKPLTVMPYNLPFTLSAGV